MELKDVFSLSIPAAIAVAGWIAGHLLSSRREIEQKKREFRVKHLRDAYIKIANLCDRGHLPEDIADLQDALNDIQLFGEEGQIALVGEVVKALSSGGSADFNELLKQLRNEIRVHIGLAPLASLRWYLRARPRSPEAGER